MKIFHTKTDLIQELEKYRSDHKTIGLVPTMGSLHIGHLDLVDNSKLSSDITIVSIFVNPIQFNNNSDLRNYPRNLNKDLELLEETGVNVVFAPDEKEMYPAPVKMKMDFGELERTLEGEFRPGHFNGVGIVVSKLLHIVQPDHAYFGQKDLQQVAIIRRLVNDLSFRVELKVVATRRERDGLALSSRNELLDKNEREAATILYKSLHFAKYELLKGESWLAIKEKVKALFSKEAFADLEYFELVDAESMIKVEELKPNESCAICVAAYIGNVRLIDNISIR